MDTQRFNEAQAFLAEYKAELKEKAIIDAFLKYADINHMQFIYKFNLKSTHPEYKGNYPEIHKIFCEYAQYNEFKATYLMIDSLHIPPLRDIILSYMSKPYYNLSSFINQHIDLQGDYWSDKHCPYVYYFNKRFARKRFTEHILANQIKANLHNVLFNYMHMGDLYNESIDNLKNLKSNNTITTTSFNKRHQYIVNLDISNYLIEQIRRKF